MVPGLDSKPPTNAQIAAAKADGRRVWAGYLGDPGDGIAPDHLWSAERFQAVLAAGMGTFAYVSGAQNPVGIAARAAAIGIRIAVDCERFIREDGPWVPGWLAASGAGLYGNGSVHYDSNGFRRAAFHVFAGYYGYDPGLTWPGWLPHDSTPTAWQWKGTTSLFGTAVDLNWFDDSFAQLHGGGSGSLGTEEEMRLIRNQDTGAIAALGSDARKTPINATAWGLLGSPPPNGYGDTYRDINQAQWDSFPDAPSGSAVDLKAILDAIRAVPAGTVNLQPVLDAIAAAEATSEKVEAALKAAGTALQGA